MNLEMIANKLSDDGVAKKGITLFVNQMPVDAKVGVLLRPPYIGTPIDYELPGYRKTKFTASIRGTTYKEANDLAQRVMESLTVIETELDGIAVKFIRPVTEPVLFPVSDAGMTELLVLFETVYVIVAG